MQPCHTSVLSSFEFEQNSELHGCYSARTYVIVLGRDGMVSKHTWLLQDRTSAWYTLLMSIINRGFKGRPDQGRRLPPGQTAVDEWPVLTYGPTPRIATSNWALAIEGEVSKPVVLDWDAFNRLPKTQMTTDIHCVTRWSRLGMPWEGVSIDELIAAAGGLTSNAKFLIASSYGGYTTNVPVADVTNGQALVATMADGQPLPAEHGGPQDYSCRTCTFGKARNGYKS